MSGCVPTNDQVNTHLCIGCHKAVNHCECLWSNFQDLSEIVSDLSMNIDKLLSSNKRQPFKCPVCNGTKLIQSKVETKILRFDSCVACEGKGIVWG